MDAEINNVIYKELNSGPKIANSTCGKTIIAGTIDRDSTVLMYETSQQNTSHFTDISLLMFCHMPVKFYIILK